MNAGIQDAFNLGWKLLRFVREKADAAAPQDKIVRAGIRLVHRAMFGTLALGTLRSRSDLAREANCCRFLACSSV